MDKRKQHIDALKKTETITIRVAAEEKKMLTLLAWAHQKSLSKYLIQLAFDDYMALRAKQDPMIPLIDQKLDTPDYLL